MVCSSNASVSLENFFPIHTSFSFSAVNCHWKESKKPKWYEKHEGLPVTYKSQKYSWTTSGIFKDRYESEFICSMCKKMVKMKKTGNVLLFVDKCPNTSCS